MEKKQNKFPNKKKILYLCNSITKEYQQYQIKNISEMTKADIINEIAASTGLQKKEVAVVVESFMSKVKESLLEKKENVYLRGFGSFIIKHRAAKTARNIQKNTTITIDAHNLPSFKPSKSFVNAMKESN